MSTGKNVNYQAETWTCVSSLKTRWYILSSGQYFEGWSEIMQWHTIWWHMPRGNYNYLLKKKNMRKTIWKSAPQTCSTFVSRMIDICNVSESSHRSNFPTAQNTWASRLFVWGSFCSLFSIMFILLVYSDYCAYKHTHPIKLWMHYNG
jgi:hypothetical protein